MIIKVIGTIMGSMAIKFGTKFKMTSRFFNHGIINRKKKG